MKKLFLFFFALVVSVGMAWADKTVYFKPGSGWLDANAATAAYVWQGENNTWINPVNELKISGDVYIRFIVPDTYTNIKFTRRDPNTSTPSEWNHTVDATITVDNALYTHTDWTDGVAQLSTESFTHYASSTFNTIYLHPGTWYESADPVDYAAYAYTDDNNNDWFKFTPLADTHVYTAQIPSDYSYLVLTRLGVDAMLSFTNAYNQTNNYSIGDNNTMYMIDSWHGGDTWDGHENKSTAHTLTNLDNLALMGKAKASSGTAQLAIDGLTNTRWESSSSDPQTWQLDLGASKQFNAIKIVWEAAYGKTFTIEAGNSVDGNGDLTGGTTIATISGQTLNGTFPYTQIISVPTTTARYIKFNGTERGTGYGYSFWEFEVYNENDNAVTSFTSALNIVSPNIATDLGLHAYNQYNRDITNNVTITTNNGTISNGVLTAATLGTATITATGDNNSTATVNITVMPEIPTAPTVSADLVDAVFSAKYDRTTTNNNPTWGLENSGIAALWTSCTTATNSNHTYIHVTDGTGWGNRPASALTEDYTTAYVALYPTHATHGKMFADGAYTSAADFNLTPGQWNYISVSLPNTSNYVMVELYTPNGNSKTPETEFYLDHFYFKKLAEGEVDVLSPDANGIAKVIGTITSSNKNTVEACTAKVIDMRNATTEEATLSFNSSNPNTLYLVPCTYEGDDITPTSITPTITLTNDKNVIAKPDRFYFALEPIVYTDQNEYQPVSFSINTRSQGYTITRSIPAGKYVTAAPMAAVTAPEGINVYEFTDYTAGSVTFTKKANNNLAIKTPYVLHNTTDSPIDLVVSGTGDLNPTVDAVTVTQNSANFIANLSEITTTGTQYVLSSGTIYKGNGMKVGAYRAYFTDVAAAVGAKAIFIDSDETTKIGTINANGEIEVGEVYNLAGQRVQNPTKGIYIINGKKVVLK